MSTTSERIILEGTLREAVAAPGAGARALAAGRLPGVDAGAAWSARESAGSAREMDVIALCSGTSKNGFFYTPEVAASLVPLLEGAQAFADHPGPQDRPERSVRDLVGFYRHAHVEEGRSAGSQRQAQVVARLHLLESAGWLESMLREALEQGMPQLLGFSIDVQGQVETRRDDATGQMVRAVTRFVALNSCDVVTKPSAGGRLLGTRRESAGARATNGSEHAGTRFPHAPAAAGAGRAVSSQGGMRAMDETTDLKDGYYYKEYEARARQRICETDGWNGSGAALQETEPPATPEQLAALRADAERALEAAQRAQRLAECELLLGRRLGESHLPGPVASKLRRRFEGRVFEAHDLERAIGEERETLAALAGLGLIREMGYEKPLVSSMVTEAEKIQAAFDRMFDLEVDARFAGVRAFSGIREAYARVSGDPAVRGISNLSTLGMIKVDGHAPLMRITEADLTTASFSYLLGTSMNKRLLHDYQAWPAEWRRFCTEVPIKDFKQQTRVRLGSFGSLSTVAEDTAYTTLTLGDAAATYSASKRGNIVTISRETIVNFGGI